MCCRSLRRRPFRLIIPVVVNAGLWCTGSLGYGSVADDGEEPFPSLLRLQEAEDPAPLQNETVESPWRTFELAGGVAYSTLTSTLLMTHSQFAGAGLAADGEELLGLQRELLTPDAWTSFRFLDRHRLKFHFEDCTRSATQVLQQSITVNGNVFQAGTTVHSVFGVQQFDLSYIWSFLKNDCMEIGFSVHADVVRLHLAIEAESLLRQENERLMLPVPLFGFDADFILAKNLWLRQDLEALYLPLENASGVFIEARTGLEYSILKNLSLGIGVNFWIVELEKMAAASAPILGDFDGKFRFTSAGLLLYLNFHL